MTRGLHAASAGALTDGRCRLDFSDERKSGRFGSSVGGVVSIGNADGADAPAGCEEPGAPSPSMFDEEIRFERSGSSSLSPASVSLGHRKLIAAPVVHHQQPRRGDTPRNGRRVLIRGLLRHQVETNQPVRVTSPSSAQKRESRRRARLCRPEFWTFLVVH